MNDINVEDLLVNTSDPNDKEIVDTITTNCAQRQHEKAHQRRKNLRRGKK